MGISGDAILDDGLPDLGDRRHKNLLKKNKRKAVNGGEIANDDDGQEDDGLELLGFEVMDSEDDSDDAEDPFKLVQRKRAATSIVDEGFSSRKVIKRSKTDPGESKKKKKKDLLSVLLPDNVDSSAIEKDFSIIQESTQMTSMVSHGDQKEDDNNSLKAEDLKSVLEDDEDSQHTNDESEGSQDIVLEKIEVYDVAGSKGWYEKDSNSEKRSEKGMADNKKEQEEEFMDERVTTVADKIEQEDSIEELDAEAFNKKENVQMDNSVPTVLSEEPNTIKEDNTETNETQPDVEKDSLPAAVTTPKKGATTTRPTKRKSTLAELCAKKTPIPYRVGLSKRANINHLHSYLSKK